ncbi:MAG: alpha/beta hydrolase [Cyanobacteria bacterium J06588_4]
MFKANLWETSWFYLLSILSVFGLFLSLWIVVPAPTFSLLPLRVAALELSPWLMAIEIIALALAIFTNVVTTKSGWSSFIILCSLLGLLLSLLPLIQFPSAEQMFQAEVERVLGTEYLAHISPAVKSKMRPQPFVLADVFRGIRYSDIRITRDLVFASPDGVDLKLNTYQPLNKGKYPTLIVTYGGAWRTGSPSSYEQFSSYMAAQGYTVINIDYRHAPQYKFPKQLEDVEAALEYIQTHADELEVDLDKIAIMGRSAGGHLATLAAYRTKIISFKAIVNYYAPVDLADGYYDLPVPDPLGGPQILENFIGGSPSEKPELYRQASLTTYLKADSPPSLLIYASRDHLVMAKFGRGLYEKLKATDNPAILLEIPWTEHAFDAVFNGVSNQLALYYTERFLAFRMSDRNQASSIEK